MVQIYECDFVVIGSGPAGQKAAIQAAKLGKKVLMVDKSERLGGACLHHGTIPSKGLREAILDLTGFRERSFYGQGRRDAESISMVDLTYRLDKVIEQQEWCIREALLRNEVGVILGEARFRSVDLLEIFDEEGELSCRIQAKRILIATGSRPRNPSDIPFDEDCILDSDRLLKMKRLPESMLVLGSGVIGCEYATMMGALGTKVTLIDKYDRPLGLLDEEISIRFALYLEEMGLDLKFGHEIQAIRKTPEGRAQVKLSDGQCLEAETLFFALGRLANVEGLDLDRIGLCLTDRGYIPVNPLFQTAWPNIYAAGDVIGHPALAATSMEQGRLAALNAFAQRGRHFPEIFPVGIYTIPEVSCVGKSEQDLEKIGMSYRVGKAYYSEIARGSISGDTTGLIKLIFHDETLEILGCHIIGTGAAELVHIIQVAMDHNAKADYLVDTVFNYPTFAEGLRIAALNGLNKSRAFESARKLEPDMEAVLEPAPGKVLVKS